MSKTVLKQLEKNGDFVKAVAKGLRALGEK
jgi:hypothetical protein